MCHRRSRSAKYDLDQKLLWYSGTILKCLSLIILSVRTDRLFDLHYLKHHWLHYGGILAMVLLAWTPQLIDTLGSLGILQKGIFELDHLPSFIFCTFTLFFYILSVSFFFKIAKPLMLARLGKATTLRFWEYFVTFCWLVQTLGFWVFTITPPVLVKELSVIPTWLTTSVGVVFIVSGIAAKMGAIWGTGYNTYYWYDMVVDIPNAYFVEVGIYRFVGSPTYTLGRGTSFGVAVMYRSLPVMVAAVVDLVLINVFDQLVEQAFVKEMYLKPKAQEGSTGGTQMDS